MRTAESCDPETEGSAKGRRALLAGFLCGTCNHLIQWIRSPFCSRCGRPFDAPLGVDHPCGSCLQESGTFDRARSVAVYQGAFKDLICAFKYLYRVELAVPLSRLLWQTLDMHWDLQQIDCIVPVPLHNRRLKVRGFNQTELMIRSWSAASPAEGRRRQPPIWSDNLVRCRCTPPQTGLNRRQRAANMIDAFRLVDSAAVRGCRVLLVDDVLTTGATIDACCRVLRSAKAASVEVLTLARAI
jgi:ComF family protein